MYSPAAGFDFRVTPKTGADRVAFIRLRALTDPLEGFYGLGEYFDSVNHRGKVRAMQLELEPGTESSYNEAHVPVPFVTGTRGRGLFVESPYPMAFDVAGAGGEHRRGDGRDGEGVGRGPAVPRVRCSAPAGRDEAVLSSKDGAEFRSGVLFEITPWAAKPDSVKDGATALDARDGLAALEAAASGWAYDGAAPGGVLYVKVGPGQHAVAVAK